MGEKGVACQLRLAKRSVILIFAPSVIQLSRPDLLSIYEMNLLLVPPDKHIAWRGDTIPEGFHAILQQVTGRSPGI
jgi:hypothetical protein